MGSRAHAIYFVLDPEGRPVSGADVTVYQQGTTTKITETIYSKDDPDSTVLSNPFPTDSAGKAEAYLAVPKRVDLYITKTGFTAQRITTDFSQLLPTTLILQDEGTPMPQRSTLDFIGAGVTVTDDSVNAKSRITIPGEVTTNAVQRGEIQSAQVLPNETTTSGAFADLTTAGPAVTVTVGASGKALVFIGADTSHEQATAACSMAYAISGATTRAASDSNSLVGRQPLANQTSTFNTPPILETGLTPGSNTFTAKYKIEGGTSRGGFAKRRITVIPL